MPPKYKNTKVIYRKLGKEKACGLPSVWMRRFDKSKKKCYGYWINKTTI